MAATTAGRFRSVGICALSVEPQLGSVVVEASRFREHSVPGLDPFRLDPNRSAPTDRRMPQFTPFAGGVDGVPPIDRQYTVRFFQEPRDQCSDSNGKFRMIMLPPSLDAQVGLFRSMCLEIKRLAGRVEPEIFERDRRNTRSLPRRP